MSLPFQSFEYTVEVELNDELDKYTENLIKYVNYNYPPFQIQYCKDDDEKIIRTYFLHSTVNAHNVIYTLFNPLRPVYTCYHKTRIVM